MKMNEISYRTNRWYIFLVPLPLLLPFFVDETFDTCVGRCSSLCTFWTIRGLHPL